MRSPFPKPSRWSDKPFGYYQLAGLTVKPGEYSGDRFTIDIDDENGGSISIDAAESLQELIDLLLRIGWWLDVKPEVNQ